MLAAGCRQRWHDIRLTGAPCASGRASEASGRSGRASARLERRALTAGWHTVQRHDGDGAPTRQTDRSTRDPASACFHLVLFLPSSSSSVSSVLTARQRRLGVDGSRSRGTRLSRADPRINRLNVAMTNVNKHRYCAGSRISGDYPRKKALAQRAPRSRNSRERHPMRLPASPIGRLDTGPADWSVQRKSPERRSLRVASGQSQRHQTGRSPRGNLWTFWRILALISVGMVKGRIKYHTFVFPVNCCNRLQISINEICDEFEFFFARDL